MSPPPAAKSAAYHLISGTDEFGVSRAARALVDELCPPAEQAFGLETIDGSVEKVDDVALVLRRVQEALCTVGFFGSGKVVWLRDAIFFGDLVRLGNEEVKPRLAALLAELKKGLLPGQYLVISTSALDRRSAFYKASVDLARRQEFNVPEKAKEADASARDFCAAELERRGLRARGGALESFINRCGNDRRQNLNEIEKLDLYLGERREFTVDDVQAIVSSARELPMWDLLDDFGARDLGRTLTTLRQLLFQKEAPIGLLIGLEGRVRDLLILKDCAQRRWMSRNGYNLSWQVPAEGDAVLAALGNDPRKLHPFRAAKLAEQADRFTLEELRACHRRMLDTHERMVSTPVAPELLLEFFLIRSLGGARRAAAR